MTCRVSLVPASRAICRKAKCRWVEPPGDSRDRLRVARPWRDFVVAERQEAAVLDGRQIPGHLVGLQELLFLRGRRSAVIIDDDALRFGCDDLLPGHRGPALLPPREDIRPAAQADQRRGHRGAGTCEGRGLATVVVKDRHGPEPGDLGPRRGDLCLHGADDPLRFLPRVEYLAQLAQVLVGIFDTDGGRAGLYVRA